MPDYFYTGAYIRLSREDGDREESDSVANQKKLLADYIKKHKELLLYNMYVDDGYSGITFQRPGFQQMIADIENKKISCVIVKDLSRFGRDYIETGRFLERYFPQRGIRFISVSDHIDSTRQSYDMLLPSKIYSMNNTPGTSLEKSAPPCGPNNTAGNSSAPLPAMATGNLRPIKTD